MRLIFVREAFTIGACTVDISKGHRSFAQQFRMETEDGVIAFIRDLPVIQERKHGTDGYAYADVIMDFKTAVDRADLTEEERAAYRKGSVLPSVPRKIAAVFREWEYDNV